MNLNMKLYKLAGGQGLEPQYHPPKGCVLPLDDPPIYTTNKELKYLKTKILIYLVFS